jgi:hypothetical protein
MCRNAGRSCILSVPDKRGILTKRRSAENWRNVIQSVETTTRISLGIACIDLDSVLLFHNPEDGISRLGRPLSLGRKLTWYFRKKKCKVIVLTSRPKLYEHGRIHQHLESLGFAVDRVTNIKPPADCYVDDKAIRVAKNWR